MNPRKYTKRNMEKFLRDISKGNNESPLPCNKHPELLEENNCAAFYRDLSE